MQVNRYIYKCFLKNSVAQENIGHSLLIYQEGSNEVMK